MISKFEAIGIFSCVGVMAFALFLMRLDSTSDILSFVDTDSQLATVVATSDTEQTPEEMKAAIAESFNALGTMEKMIVDDVIVGEGSGVKTGDTVSVHYIGTLQNGQQFDNSYTKGDEFSFTVGEGRVIKGWDEGVIGMKKGGQRILVIPAELAYGSNAVGPIPANSTLVFVIELISIK